MAASHRPQASWTSPSLAVVLLGVVATVCGCATAPDSEHALLNRWTQLGPGGNVSLRAIVGPAADCPTAVVDGDERRLLPRARATPATPRDGKPDGNPAFEPAFAVTSCELVLPALARQASIAGQPVSLPKAQTTRIVVLGDTGCRIKVPASGPADPIQDCSSPGDWPWQRIAAAAARARPDLVIHLGDYHYREYCDNPASCSPVRKTEVAIGYDWAGWNADFFAPATPLLTAAPWIMVRGNHENCDRGGEGWMRFLSPVPYRACGDQTYRTATRSVLANNGTADAYRVDLDASLTLVVADNAGHEDYRPAIATPQDVEIFRRTLAALLATPPARASWLLVHRPLWYDLLQATSQPNALQAVLATKLPASVQFVLAGHEHAFETINFARDADPANYPAGRPAQILVGTGGTQLEAFDPTSLFYEGQNGAGSKERPRPIGTLYDGVAASSGIVLNRYGFLLLERQGENWSATLMDPDGLPISHCRPNGERKEIICSFPGA